MSLNRELTICITFITFALLIGVIDAWPFGPEPVSQSTPEVTWTPVDKVWVYQQVGYNYGRSENCPGIKFYATYRSNQGVYEVREVDATTWYNIYISISDSLWNMYTRGAK